MRVFFSHSISTRGKMFGKSRCPDKLRRLISLDDCPIPADVLPIVFSYLDGRSLGRASCVCRQWKVVGNCFDGLWKLQFKKEFKNVLDKSTETVASWRDAYRSEWLWLNGKFRHKMVTHNRVRAKCLLLEGSTLVIGCRNGLVQVWDVETVRFVGERWCHREPVNRLCLSKNSSTVISGANDVCAWNSHTNHIVFRLSHRPTSWVSDIKLASNKIIAFFKDTHNVSITGIRICCAQTGECNQVYETWNFACQCFRVTDGYMAWVDNGGINVWNLTGNESVTGFDVGDEVMSIAIGFERLAVAVHYGNRQYGFQVWDLHSKTTITTFKNELEEGNEVMDSGHGLDVHFVNPHQVLCWVLVGGDCAVGQVYDIETDNWLYVIRGEGVMAYYCQGPRILVLVRDEVLNNQLCIHNIQNNDRRVLNLGSKISDFGVSGNRFALLDGDDGKVWMWGLN